MMLLLKCDGDEIWDEQTCRQAGVPDSWIIQLKDRHESGFDSRMSQIFVDNQLVNQYEGVHDLKLALKLADYLGIDWERIVATKLGRRAIVTALKEELDEI